MNNSRLRIALITAVMVLLSVGFTSAACYLNVVQDDSSEYEGYLNVSMDISTSAPYTAEIMLSDDTQTFFPDAVVDNILLNIPADQIESVTDADGNEWEVNEVTEDAANFGSFNTSIQPGEDVEVSSETTITINFVDTWDQSFPRNDEGYLTAVQISNIGENSDDSAWVTIGFCEEETPIEENATENETIADENVTDDVVIDENVTDDDMIIIIGDNETVDNETAVPDNETVDNETTVETNVTAAADCYMNIVQEDKSEYDGQLNASVMIDNESNTVEIELTNDTLETFQDARLSMIQINTPVELIENVTDANGNELESTEMNASDTTDTPFGRFLTIISSLLGGEEDAGFGDFLTMVTVSEAGNETADNLTGPITITYTDGWNGTIPVNEEGYSIAAEVQNIGDTGDDNAWITVGVCEAADETAQEMDIVETAAAAGSFETLVMALGEANLTETLSGEGPFTVFAPTDEAFDALPEGTLDQLLQDPENLTAVLTYHVVPGEYMSSDITDMESLTTVQGEEINVTVEGDNIMVDDANVTTADIEASNGVIHVIDSVMLPPSMIEASNETGMNDIVINENEDMVTVGDTEITEDTETMDEDMGTVDDTEEAEDTETMDDTEEMEETSDTETNEEDNITEVVTT